MSEESIVAVATTRAEIRHWPMSTVTLAQKVFFDDGEMVEDRLGLVTGLSHRSLTNIQIRALCVPVPYAVMYMYSVQP